MPKPTPTPHVQSSLLAVIHGVPPTATAQQKGAMVMPGTKHIRFYKKASVLKAERTWWEMLRPVRAKLPAPFEGPISVHVTLVYPHLAGTAKKRLGTVVPLGKRPDIDNIAKSLLDTMTSMEFWHDDGQIYGLTLLKFRGPEPRAAISIYPEVHETGNEIKVDA